MLRARGSRLSGDRLHPAKHPQEIAALDLADLLFRITSLHQLARDAGCFAFIVEANETGTMVEGRADPHVVDADALDEVVDVVDVIAQGYLRHELAKLTHEGSQLVRRQCVDAFFGADGPTAARRWQTIPPA
jgi:hypothetical protein